MCGRFAINQKTNEYIEQLVAEHGYQVLKHLQDFFPRYNLKPTNQVAVLMRSAKLDTGVLTTARWGMIPPSVKSLQDAPRTTFNARAESATISERSGRPSMWSGPLKKGQRCLIPMSGFYEWTGPAGKKTPHYIHPEGPVLMAAGLYGWWKDPAKTEDDPEKWMLTATMFVMPAAEELAEVHDRNPVALPESMWWDWIDPATRGDQELVDEAVAASTEVMARLEEYTVRPFGRDDDGPELLEPAS